MRLAVRVLVVLFSAVFGAPVVHLPRKHRYESPLSGWNTGHVAGFLKQFPTQHEVQLVGIVDADTELSQRYAKQFHLDSSLFYGQLDAMIAACHPQALLVSRRCGASFPGS